MNEGATARAADEAVEPWEAPASPGLTGGDMTGLGHRALRTRQKIIDTTKQLFLERGYLGTSVNSITTACGISRAGFYTYFRDKREIFDILGETVYRDLIEVVEKFETLPQPPAATDIEQWVREYFTFMGVHGSFILSSQSAPTDEDVQVKGNRMQMRVAWMLGMRLRGRQRTPTREPEALGLVAQSMLERSWFHSRSPDLPVDEEDVVRAVATFLAAVLAV